MLENISYLSGASSKIPPPLGLFEVSCLPFRVPGSVFCKVFYPCANKNDPEALSSTGSEHEEQRQTFLKALPEYRKEVEKCFGYNLTPHLFKTKFKYTRKKVLEGFSKWMQAPKFFFDLMLGHTKINYSYLQPPIYSQKFPVAIFSHGLGGNADIYSKICTDLASFGYIVFALEHEDGSGTYACSENVQSLSKEHIFYNHPPGLEYNRSNTVSFRSTFLKKRIQEVRSFVSWISSVPSFLQKPEVSTIERHIFSQVNSSEIYLVGHSFGGASMTQFSVQEKVHQDSRFKAVFLLDVWGYPLPDETLRNGIKLPVAGVLTERFLNSPTEYWPDHKLFSNSNSKMFTVLRGVTHTQMSDGPWFCKWNWVKSGGLLEGELKGEESQREIMNALTNFFKAPASFSLKKLADTKLEDISHIQPKHFD